MEQLNFKQELEARGFKTTTEFQKVISRLKEYLDPKTVA